MKIGCIALNSNLISCEKQTKIIEYLSSKLYEIGESFSLISYFENGIEKIRDIVSQNFKLLFVIGTNDVIYNHNIKDNISRIVGDKLEINPTASQSLKSYCAKFNIPFSIQEEMETNLPTKSIPLVFEESFFNGFMYKHNDTILIYIPSDFELVENNYSKYILPLINDLTNSNCNVQIIKCFGILEKDIKNLILDCFGISGVEINIVSDDLDSTIFVRFSCEIEQSKQREIISNIISKLNKFIYSLDNSSIYKMAVELLKVQHKSIIVCETLTYGEISKNLSLIDNDVINFSGVYPNFDIIQREIKIDSQIISDYGKYSVNTVYELANAMLETKTGDLVLFVLGDKNSDICYMAIGDFDGIHVYKNKINIKNLNLIDNLSKTALFYLIKKLKQNDLCFWYFGV